MAVVDHLHTSQPGVYSCPAGLFLSVDLRFLGRGGRPLARAVESPTGCPSVVLRLPGRHAVTLQDSTRGAVAGSTAVSDGLRRLSARFSLR